MLDIESKTLTQQIGFSKGLGMKQNEGIWPVGSEIYIFIVKAFRPRSGNYLPLLAAALDLQQSTDPPRLLTKQAADFVQTGSHSEQIYRHMEGPQGETSTGTDWLSPPHTHSTPILPLLPLGHWGYSHHYHVVVSTPTTVPPCTLTITIYR